MFYCFTVAEQCNLTVAHAIELMCTFTDISVFHISKGEDLFVIL